MGLTAPRAPASGFAPVHGEQFTAPVIFFTEVLTPTELRMLCASMTVTPRLSGSPSISPALDATGVSVDPALTGTVTIERC